MVGRLAHGQRQWVELGMVIAAEPWLVLLDEPAAGMTHEETARTAELIREINPTAALIVVEHDMQFIRMISQHGHGVPPGAHPDGGHDGRHLRRPAGARSLSGASRMRHGIAARYAACAPATARVPVLHGVDL